MGKTAVTMQNISDCLGISKVSVSKAINGQPGVGEALRKKILETASEMGYMKSGSPDSSSTTIKLGFLIAERYFLDNEDFYRVMYRTILDLCAQKGIQLQLFILSRQEETEGYPPAGFISAKVDGILVAGEMEDAFFELVVRTGQPLAALDFYKPFMQQDTVITDNYQAGFHAAWYIIENNHKEIGFVGNLDSSSNLDRFFGYRKALAMKGLDFREEWHIRNMDRANCEFIDYILPDKLPTAFLCHCDLAACHLIAKLQSRGMEVPEDVSLVSFDNTALAQSFHPAITSIDIDKKGMGTKGLELLLRRIENKRQKPERMVLETKLIERDTVRKL